MTLDDFKKFANDEYGVVAGWGARHPKTMLTLLLASVIGNAVQYFL